jgi:hypothetical protein
MFGFSKKASPISTSEFEKQVSALVILGRLANVSRADMAMILAREAAGLQREIQNAREERNMRTAPVQHDSYGNRIAP